MAILMVHSGVEHVEGGWPREIRHDNEELRIRHVRRWQRDDGYVHAINSLSSTMEHCIHQNNAVSVYETYYDGLKPMPSVQMPEIHIRNVYRAGCQIPVSTLAWTNELNPKVVAAHAYTDFISAFKDSENGFCCIWDIEKQIKPILEYRPQSALWCVACSQRDPAIIVGGMYNGKVCEWDSRCGSLARCTPTHEAHMDPVTAITYTHSRTHTEIFSGSLDGQCSRWDTRNLNQSIEKIVMDLSFKNEEPSLSQAEGITSLAFDKGFPTRLLVGLESGSIVNINRKGKTPQELLSSKWSAHHGKVRAVHRNPNFLKLFISCGDWNTKIFADDIRCAPIFSGIPAEHFISDVSWSSTRLSSYMTAASDGMFRFHDLLRKLQEPVALIRLSSKILTKLCPHEEGKMISVGDSEGNVTLLTVTDNMVQSEPNDRALLSSTVERESRREHILETRAKEIRIKLEQKQQLEVESIAVDSLADVEKEYYDVIEKELGYKPSRLLPKPQLSAKSLTTQNFSGK